MPLRGAAPAATPFRVAPLFAILLAACGEPPIVPANIAALHEFRTGVPEVSGLGNGVESRDALTRRFLTAIQQHDTAALSAIAVDRAEFAWLVYPNHLYSRAPYDFEPATLWTQYQEGNASGLQRVLEEYGGITLSFEELTCERDQLQFVTGPMKLWGECRVTLQAHDRTVTAQLFWSIVELHGKFKFLSYKTPA